MNMALAAETPVIDTQLGTDRMLVSSPVELAAARDAAGLTLAGLSERLRIDPSRLAALENGNWDRLPSRAFARAGLRSVAGIIGVNAAPLIESIGDPANVADLRMGMRPQAAVPVITASMTGLYRQRHQSARGWRRWAVPGVACAVALVGVALVAGGNSKPAGAGSTSRIVSVPVPGAGKMNTGAIAVTVPSASRPAIRVTESVRRAGSGGSLVAAPVAVASAGLAGQQAAAMRSVKAPIQPAVLPAADPPAMTFPVKLPPTEPVELRFAKKAWVDIRHKDGEKLLFGTQKAGKTVVLQGVPPMKVVIGNPDGVKMRFRGEPVDLKPTIKKGVSRLVLN